MSPVEAYRKRIAEQNHVLLDRDEPILIMLTFFEQYEEDLAKLSEVERQKFVSLLEMEQDKCTTENERRAERLINASLKLVDEEARKTLKVASDEFIHSLEEAIGRWLALIEKKERAFTLLGTIMVICSAILAISLLLFLLLH